MSLGINAGFNNNFGAVSANTWAHIAVTRSSGVIRAFVNGVQGYSTTDTTNYTASYMNVGGYYSTTYVMLGYIDDLRITKGVARYTSNFQPPQVAFANQ